MAAVGRVELREARVLAVEQLHGAHARDVLLQHRVDARDPDAHLAVERAHVRPEPLRDNGQQRQHGEAHQREPPVHQQQGDDDACERQHVAEHRDNAGGEEIVERVDVGSHACHEAADGIAVVVAEVELLQMAVNLAAQVEHDLLPDLLQRVGLVEFQHEQPGERREQHAGNRAEAVDLSRGDVLVDRDLHQPRLQEAQRGREKDRDERQHGLPLVRAEVFHQPAHQPRVVRLAENFLLGVHDASSSCSRS